MTTLTLTLYRVTEGGDAGRRFRHDEHPELGRRYTTEERARAAAEAILARVRAAYERQCEAHNALAQPDAAERAWKDKRQTACFSEVRLDHCEARWERDGSRTGWTVPPPYTVTMIPRTSARYRWRDVVQRIEARADGQGSITYSLGEPSPWTSWHDTALGDAHGGGPYLPPVALVVVRESITFESGDDLRTWAEGIVPAVTR